MVEFARDSVVPERVEPSVLDVDVELCLIELDVDFSVRRVVNSERYLDLLKYHNTS